ncbi:hypothetical protein BS78_09G085700 [Paspalum vaginatum]|nr:hypothetical protein BS78_09G085700 [Paspalum vaginatum]
MTCCWSSVLAVIGGRGADDPGKETEGTTVPALHRRLLEGKTATASEKQEIKKLTAQVRTLQDALVEMNSAREAVEAKRREADARAEELEAERRTNMQRHEAQVEELRLALDAQENMDARIRELEERIRDHNNATSKWRFF